MSEQQPDPEGTTPDSEEMVSGEGGPSLTQGGAMPGGSELEGSKKPPSDDPGAQGSIEEQGERLRERLEGS